MPLDHGTVTYLLSSASSGLVSCIALTLLLTHSRQPTSSYFRTPSAPTQLSRTPQLSLELKPKKNGYSVSISAISEC